MKKLSCFIMLALMAVMVAQAEERKITVTENIAYRTDVGPSTVLDLAGGMEDVAWKNAQMDYDAIKKIPVVLADNTTSGHGGTYEQPCGGDNSRMVRAWLDWQLKGRQEPKALFIDGDLTGYDKWTIKHKNF